MSELKQPWRTLYSQLHFGDGRHFDSHLAGRSVDVDFYMQFAKSGIKLLDLGSGTGRFAIPAAKRGSRVTGVDLLPSMMKLAKEKAVEHGVDIEWIEGDFLAVDLPGGFDVVIAPFNFLAQFPLGSLTALLRRIRPLLREKGRLVFDIMNPDLFGPEYTKPAILHYDSPDGRGPVSLAMEIKIVGDEIHGLQHYEFKSGEKHTDEIRLAAITSDALREALKVSGFQPGKWLGSFAGKDFAPRDPARIVETTRSPVLK